jgi:hypothetical protein
VKDLKEKLKKLEIFMLCSEEERERLFKEVFPTMPPAPSWKKETIEGYPVIIVRCSQEWIDWALELGNVVHKAAKLRKLKEYIPSNPEYRRCGLLGQFAWAFYFNGDWSAAFDYITIGKADNGDFELGNFIINIITRSGLYEDEDYAIIDKKRFERKPYPVYIACTRVEDEIIIWGYATFNEVMHWDIDDFGYGDAYYQDVKKLHPIEELKEILLPLLPK